MKLFLVNSDGTHVQQLPWNGEFAGFAVFERGDQSIVLGGQDARGIVQKTWRLPLDGSPPTLLFENCGMAADVTPDRQFYLTSTLWTEDSSISEYSMADKKCTVLIPKLATYLAMFARDGKSFYYSVAAHGETTIFRQPWHDGVLAGPSTPAVKLPFAMREDYGGNAFAVSPDLSAVVFARPNSYDDLYFLSRP
ncbi:MAG: hypothetical protein WBQ61_23695 [Candidatus Acidiferrum sp.]